MDNAGYLLGITRTVHPGPLATPSPGRIAAISAGVLSSLPGQNGQNPPSGRTSPPSAKSSGRRLLSLAMITQRFESGSCRSSDIGLLPAGRRSPPRPSSEKGRGQIDQVGRNRLERRDRRGQGNRHEVAPPVGGHPPERSVVNHVGGEQAVTRSEPPVERGRGSPPLNVAELHGARLAPGARLDLPGDPLADAPERYVPEGVQLLGLGDLFVGELGP